MEEENADMKEWKKEAEEEESKSENRERWREEENGVIKRRCVKPISSDVFWGEISPMDESDSLGDSCGDSCGDSAMCVPAVSSCVLVVTDVSFSLSMVSVLGEDFLFGFQE